MIRPIPNNATYETTATLSRGNEIWELYIYKCNEGTYVVLGEIKILNETTSFHAEEFEEPEVEEIYVNLGLWNAGKNEREAIKLLLKKVDELETFMNETFEIIFR